MFYEFFHGAEARKPEGRDWGTGESQDVKVPEVPEGAEVRMAYLNAQARSELDAAGVIYKSRKALQDCVMGSYVLCLKPISNAGSKEP